MKRVYQQIIKEANKGDMTKETAAKMIKFLQALEDEQQEIAIIGMAAVYPAAEDVNLFWNNIRNGNDYFTDFPQSRKLMLMNYLEKKDIEDGEDTFIKGAFLDDIDSFDCNFFHITPNDADIMDPNQRLFLQNVYHTIEDAGYINTIEGTRTGIYLGFSNDLRQKYLEFISELDSKSIRYSVAGNLESIIPSRISFFKDLKGPAVLVDTACSSSLVALHLACEAVRRGECDQAVAGGIKLNLLPLNTEEKIGIESSDGKTRPFDKDSDGTGIGEGIASVMIKPLKQALADKDHIYAIIRGSAMNQDGKSSGITAPNVDSQEDVLVRAWKNAKINPEELGFVECHGTATQLGDTIEIEALTNAFKKFTNRKQICGISATKSNIGHLYEASGITGVIKAVLCLKNKQIPQIANFNIPNDKINFENTPLYVVDKLTNWKKESYHRICGVSSFGFSGTNCHMVLEEAPEEEANAENENAGLNIFTISAKSKESLLQYIQDYKKYLLTSVQYSIREICCNTNRCKEQFQYRVAILAASKTDLYNKLNQISEDKLEGEDIFYGMPYVVYDTSKIRSGSDITAFRQQELTEQSEAVLVSMQDNDMDVIKHKLAELAGLYAAGAVINWNAFYREQIRKIPLPLYPFAKESHWVSFRDTEKITAQNKQKVLHPLVEQLIAELVDEDVYMSKLSPSTHFVLRDHIVIGMNVIAGATHLEVLRYIGWRYFETNQLELNKLEFQMPVFCNPDSYRNVFISVKRRGESVLVTMCSKDDNQEINTHLTCEVKPSYEEEAEILPIQEYMDHASEVININQNDLTKGFIEFSNNWLTYKTLYKTEEYMVGELELPGEFQNQLEIFYLHPGLLDLGINSFSLTIGKRYLPFSFENVKVYGPTPSHFYSFTRYKDVVIEGETIHFDVKLADDSGKVFLEVNNYVMKKVYSFKRLLQPNNFYSQAELEEAGKISHAAAMGKTIAVVHRQENDLYLRLIKQLTDHKNYIVDSNLCTLEIKQESENAHLLPEDQYKIMAEQWVSEGAHTIVYLLDCNKGLFEADKLEYNYNSIEQLFLVMKALAALQGEEQIRLFVVGKSDYEECKDDKAINPYHYASYTLAKVFAKEQGRIQIKGVELDNVERIQELLYEINDTSDAPLVIYRNGIRYKERYTKLNMEELSERNLIIREGGTYLITGGGGGIGLTMAEYLSNKQKVNLCLLGRTILPAKEDWNKAVNSGKNAKLIRLIQTINRIESRGSRVDYITCDVSDFNSLNQTITEIRKRYGNINGIMHCAGLPGEGYIIDKKLSEFRRVLKPKIHGTVLLHELTKSDSCDFCLLCSSIASVMALPSQSDYSAANAFMDCFAKLYENCNIVSISWPAWNDLGMAADNNVVFDTLFQTMNSKDAVYNMEEILTHKVSHVILGKWNYDERFYELVNLNVSKEIKSLLMKQRESKNGRIRKKEQDIFLRGREDNAYTPLERKLGILWGKVLGYKELDIYDSFYELGGDSILAVRLNNEINSKFSMTIRVSELFDHMTIHDFAGYLEEKLKHTERAESGLKINKAGHREYYPVTSGQKRMYFAALSMDNDTLYNIPMIFEIFGETDKNRLAFAFKELVKRQACLRMGFRSIDGNLMQYVDENLDFNFELITCEADTIKDILPGIIRSFHLEEAPLFRAGLIEAGGGRKYLFMDIHHVISDGYSLLVLVKDLMAIYNGAELEELPVSYTDFAVWENEKIVEGYFKTQEEYWLGQLKNMPEPVNLNYDFCRPGVQSSEGDIVCFEVGEELLKALQELSRRNHVTLFS
ncbi:MAG: SDR family NAD(P)-dependent oxidoreductase, partial [Ruminiclostridium sp.]